MNPEFRPQVVAHAKSIAKGSYHGAGWGPDAGLIEFARFVQEAPVTSDVFDLMARACTVIVLERGFPLAGQDDLTEVIKSVGGLLARKVGLPVNLEWRRMAERDQAAGHLSHYPEQLGRRPESFSLRPEFQAGHES